MTNSAYAIAITNALPPVYRRAGWREIADGSVRWDGPSGYVEVHKRGHKTNYMSSINGASEQGICRTCDANGAVGKHLVKIIEQALSRVMSRAGE